MRVYACAARATRHGHRGRSANQGHRQSASRHRGRSKAPRQYAAPTKRSGYRGSARSLWSLNIKRAPQRREHRQNPSKLDSWLAPLQVHKESHANAAGGGKLCLTQTERLAFLANDFRSEEHTSELQSLMRISYAVFCLKKKN